MLVFCEACAAVTVTVVVVGLIHKMVKKNGVSNFARDEGVTRPEVGAIDSLKQLRGGRAAHVTGRNARR